MLNVRQGRRFFTLLRKKPQQDARSDEAVVAVNRTTGNSEYRAIWGMLSRSLSVNYLKNIHKSYPSSVIRH
jgi:hypothetical protein